MSYYYSSSASASSVMSRSGPSSSKYQANSGSYGTSQNDPEVSDSITLYPTQSLTTPSQYKAPMPIVPSQNYPRPSTNLVPQLGASSSLSNYSLSYPRVPSHGPIPTPRSLAGNALSTLSFPSGSTCLALGVDAMNLASPSSSFDGLFADEDLPSPIGYGNGPNPVPSQNHLSSRRHPVHPEGTPQPKGRGARKPSKDSKNDELPKTLPCDGCDALFARKHDLDRHRRIHTLEAPYVCRGCNRSYRRSDARKRHWDQEPGCCVLHSSQGGGQ